MATAKFDITTEALKKPVLAYVGVTDLAVEIVRDAVADVQKRAQRTDAKVLREQAVHAVTTRVDALAKDAQARRAAIEARVAELQAEAKAYPAKVTTAVDDNVAAVNATYTDLVKRGESLVGRIRRQESTKATVKSARTTTAKAKTTATQAKKAADAEVTATKKVRTAQKTAARKAAAKKAPVRKAAAKKTAVAQSSAKATTTAAKNTATNAVKAVADAAEKVGD